MGLVRKFYKLRHPNVPDDKISARYDISVWKAIQKLIRKWLNVSVIPYIPFTNLRVSCYRMIGYKIGKDTFIGMRCYLDDLCYDKIEIGNGCIISYGVFFACHGRRQEKHKIVIKDGAYIGMRSSVIAPKGDVIIGEKSTIGAHTLVNISIPDRKTAVGVPCRILEDKRDKNNNENNA